MDYSIKIIHPEQKEFSQALVLIETTFDEFEAPDYSEEGQKEFKKFIQNENISQLIKNNQLLMWGYLKKDRLIGIVAVRPPNHIALLFVDKNYHRQGVARLLFNTAFEQIKTTTSQEITVNSSPYAEIAYKHLGFTKVGELQIVNGIQFIPMKKELF
ncbi:GNAT family N-acetyltransferase [Enterococcus rivorum]|uniref:N-acetyltransferase domain-containing protein n=1 Tax=Enterococcus rivorum TaxID=762845 RepID=A0A1E5L005_9ENTE|nr:GNAT family N-acetyltransferase [Enterococcus rivorum]MBP2100217.1 putative GNAT family N-acyltransferase [Enterococcus rivorum]OEH83438.1 hypothetical protein BCR26_09660 [Enterococcus rivorum]